MTLVILSLTVEGCHNLFSLVTTSLININSNLEAQIITNKTIDVVCIFVRVCYNNRQKEKYYYEYIELYINSILLFFH